MAEDDPWGAFNMDPAPQAAPERDPWGAFNMDPPPEQRMSRPRSRPEEDPEAEGMFATAARSFAHEAPAVVGGAAGFAAGAGLGTVAAPGIGTVVGGLAGAVAGGFGGAAVGEEAFKAVGVDDGVQRAINAKTHPWSSAAGQAAAQVLGFGAGSASTAARVAGAGIGGAIEGGAQLYEGEFDPARLVTQTAAGAAFTNQYKWGDRIQEASERAGEQIATGYRARAAEKFIGPREHYGPYERYGPYEEQGPRQPENHGAAGARAAAGTSEAQPPPTTRERDVGDIHQERGEGSEISYPKANEARVDDGSSQVHVTDTDPDVQHVLDTKAARAEPPTEYGQKLDQEFPTGRGQRGEFTTEQMQGRPGPEEHGPVQPYGPTRPEGPPEWQGPRQPYGPPEPQGPRQPPPVAEPPQGRPVGQEPTPVTPPTGPTKRPARAVDPNSLNALDYLTTQGGLRSDDFGELASIRGGGGNYNYPQGGALFRQQGGNTLDEARRILVDAGFINDEGARHSDRLSTSTTNDVLDLVREGLAGQHRYSMGNEGRVSTKEKAAIKEREAFENQRHADNVADAEKEADAFIKEYGADPAFRDRMVQYMAREGIDAETAHDRVMEEPPEAYAKSTNMLPTYERGVEGKDQAIIPGAEQASAKTMAQRASDAPMRAKANQDFGGGDGLFGTGRLADVPDELFLRRSAAEQAAEKHGGLDAASDALEARLAQRAAEIEAGTADPASFPGRQRLAMKREELDKKLAEAAAKGVEVKQVPPSRALRGKKLTSEDLVAAERGDIAPAPGQKSAARQEFEQAQQDYRARKIGDDEFLAARSKYDASLGVEPPPAAEPVPAGPSKRIDMSRAEAKMLEPKASDAPPEIPDRLTKAGFEVGRAKDGTWVLTQDGIYRGHADNAAQLVKQANGMPQNKPDWKETIPFASAKKDGVTDFDLALTRPRKAEDLAAASAAVKDATPLRDMFTNNSVKKKFSELLSGTSKEADLVRNLKAKYDEISQKIIDAGFIPGDHDKFRNNPEMVKASSDLSNIAGGLNRYLNGVVRKSTPERRAKDLDMLRSDLAAVSDTPAKVTPSQMQKEAGARGEILGYNKAVDEAERRNAGAAKADPINDLSNKILKDMGITPDEKGGTREVIGEKEFDAAAVAGEKIKGEASSSQATGKKGDFYIEKDDAKPGWVVKKGDEVISEHPNKGQAYIGLNKAATGQPVTARGTPSPMSPTGGGAVPPNVGAAVQQGAAGGLAPTPPPGGGPPPPPPPPGAGGPPPNQPNAGHAPPQQRGWFNELWRDVQRKTAAHLLGPDGMEARRLIRGAYGENYRVAEQTAHLLKEHQDTIRAMDAPDRAALINHMQGGNAFPNFVPTAEQKAFMNAHERAMQEWEAKLQTLPAADKMKFLDNYMAQMYENPNVAPNMFVGGGKRGGAGSLNNRKYATYEDAKAAGLIPKTDDPIEISTRYINSIRDFVASKQVIDRAEFDGTIGYFNSTKNVGATGTPTPLQTGGPPPGWKELKGVTEKGGKSAYAPEDFADTYNNFYDKGFGQSDKSRNAYEAVRNSTNAWTQLELGLNAYHMFTMANEAVISDVGSALRKAFVGDYAGAGATLKDAWRAPRRQYVEGKIFQKEYLDPNSTNPIASILAEANARPVGRGHAADYTFADRGSFINKFDRHSIQSELNQAWKEIQGDFANSPGIGGKSMAAVRNSARALQTVSAPIFDKYIPALKAGALNSMMKDYHAAMLKENPNFDMINNPADRRTAVNAAMKMVDSVDNRFGEMIHDNMFMNATLKQSAQMGMRSFSWAIGAMKEIGGGTAAVGKNLVHLARTGENRFKMTHPEWDPRMDYAIAFPFVVSAISTIYQGLFAGEKPESWRDLYAPKTGGTVPGVGGKGQVPEHVLMPGYQKDVLGWTHHPLQEMYNKLGGLPQTLIEQGKGTDWKGQPIVRPGASLTEAASDRMGHLFSKLGPISIKNMIKGTEPTSHISRVETALGFRAPGAHIQDPEGLERAMKFKGEREWKAKERRERKIELRQSGG